MREAPELGGFNHVRQHWRSKDVFELKTALYGFMAQLQSIDLPIFNEGEQGHFEQTTFTILHIKEALIFKGEQVIFSVIFPEKKGLQSLCQKAVAGP